MNQDMRHDNEVHSHFILCIVSFLFLKDEFPSEFPQRR